jgi:hypothetical protein
VPGGRRALIVGAAVAVVIVVVVLVMTLGGDDERGSTRSTTTTTEAPEPRAGPCDRLSAEAVDEALGGPSIVSTVDDQRCSVAREGTLVSAEIEQTNGEADEADLDAIERSSGRDTDNLEPWPEVDVEDLGDRALWLADPAGDGSYGELYVLTGSYLVRVAVSTPPDYRREARVIGIAVAEAAIADL